MGRPVIFGEVVFDVYPDGEQVLGGAPFNVAWHLRGFGLDPLMVTRVGDDENGRKIYKLMESWGMDTAGVQRDLNHPTGTVQVSYRDGEPSFEILPKQSYDYIEAQRPLIESLEKQCASLVYHGSLALRSKANQRSFSQVASETKAPIFLDVNLRDPWWSPGSVGEMLKAARWAKLNDDELKSLCGDARPEDARDLLKAYSLDAVIVTKGGQGAFVLTIFGEYFDARPPNALNIVDAVGAGDAFSAVCIAGLLLDWSWKISLERAIAFAVRICGVKGATTTDRGLYEENCDHWKASS